MKEPSQRQSGREREVGRDIGKKSYRNTKSEAILNFQRAA